MKRFKVILTIILFCSINLAAQTNQSIKDIKVGLVLSGGGAKGLAHIGVLKIIDSLGVRIDYIAGSSMGAIIGGLYASGYSAKQLDSLFYSINFNNLIQDKLPRKAKTFYEKEDAEKYALTLPIINNKIGLPTGISNGQNLYNLYSKLTTHVHHIRDLSKLPIPFFCTATDIETGEGLVLDEGYLPDIIAASGALPSVYSPVWYKNRLMTDGGVTDNYPIEEIKKRDVEIVIGVDVQDSLMNRKKLNTVTNIMLQISNFKTINDMKRKAPLTDIYMKPDIERFNVVSFQEGEKIVEEGEKKARSYTTQLKEIALNQKGNYIKSPLKPIQKLTISELKINNNTNYTSNYIKGKLRLKTPSEVSLDKLNKGLDNLYSTQNFDNIRYKTTTIANNKNIITIDLNEKKTKSFIRFGLHYDNLYKSAAIVNYTKKKLLFKNDVLSVDAILGDNSRYNIDYYVDKGYYWSFGINHRLYQYEESLDFPSVKKRRNLPDFLINIINVNYLDISTQFYLETLLNQTFAFRVGLEHKYLFNKTNTVGLDPGNVLGTVFDEISYFSLYSTIKYDSLNDKYFPTHGAYLEGKFSGYPLSSVPLREFDEFAIAKANFKYALPIAKQLSTVLELQSGIRIGNTDGINALDFFLGGFGSKEINNQIPFLGYDFLSLSGDSFVKTGITLDYNFYENHHFDIAANYGNIGNKIFDIKDWFKNFDTSGYGIGYGYNSLLGPIQVKYTFSFDENTTDQFFVSVGYWF